MDFASLVLFYFPMFCMSGLDKEGTIFCKLTFPGLDIYKLRCKYPASDCVCGVKQQCLSLDSASGRLCDPDHGHFALLLHVEFYPVIWTRTKHRESLYQVVEQDFMWSKI